MKIYFDMDGVLVDLYGKLGRDWGVDPHSLKDHAGDTPKKYRRWVLEQGGPEEAFANLPSLHIVAMQELMEDLHGKGHTLEILSSTGSDEDFHQGVFQGKRRWIFGRYGNLLHSGVLSAVNLVPGGAKKALYAEPGAFLIDDTPWIIEAFQKAGGEGLVWDERNLRENLGILLSRFSRQR